MIDWTLIGQAVEHYQGLGFEYIDTPWMVDEAVACSTCPPHGHLDVVSTNGKVLVASAEQGFLQLDSEGKLDGVNYVSAGPCFRITDGMNNYDGRHHATFMKVELYVRCNGLLQASHAAKTMAHSASRFMGNGAEVVRLDQKHSWDVEINGIEVGSYGARKHENLCWAYGTGLALPRYHEALQNQN